MKTKILSILAIAAVALGFASCSEDWEPKMEKTGQVSFSAMGVDVRGDESIARAEYDLNDFLVKIYTAGTTTNPVASWTYADMPEIFTLPVGSYRVDVMSHEVMPAEWDKPLYLGSADFDIKNNEITAVGNILCKFSSLRVTVKFSDKLMAACGNDVKVSVKAGEAGAMEFALEETRSAYFEVVDGSTTLSAEFEGSVNGYAERFHKVYTDVAAGVHRIIVFTLKGEVLDPPAETGLIDVSEGIRIQAIMYVDNLDGAIDIAEETTNPTRPGQEDFQDGFAVVPNTGDKTMAVSSPEPLASLVLDVTSDNAEANAAFAGVNGVDLLNPGDAEAALAEYHITVSASRSVSYTVDLSGLVEAAKAFDGRHSFGLTATDSEGASVTNSLNVKGGAAAGDAITFTTDLDLEGINGVDVDKAVVTIAAEAGLAHLIVDIASDNANFIASAGELVPLNFDLATVDSATAEALSSIGLPVLDEVVGQTSVDFDITQMVPLLASFPGTHKFTIQVKDQEGNEATRTLTFVAH